MPPQEWDAFWLAVECVHGLQSVAGVVPAGLLAPQNTVEDRFSKRSRSARCSNCAGCTRGDCGYCKNCLDKPKFGGPGIKKQACLQRACSNPLVEDDASDSEETCCAPESSPALASSEDTTLIPALELGPRHVVTDMDMPRRQCNKPLHDKADSIAMALMLACEHRRIEA